MTTHQAPEVTALLATYNSGERLEQTLASLMEQTYTHFRVIISDDASTDGTPERCREIIGHDQRFTLIQQVKRKGWIGNINALLRNAQTDYCFFMPHDDLLRPSYVEKLVHALEANSDAMLAYSDLDCYNNDAFLDTQRYDRLSGVTAPVQRAQIWLDQPTSGWCIPYRGLFRSSAINLFKGLRRNLVGEFAADWTWLFHMSLLGEWVRVPEILYQRNRGTHSLSESWKSKKRGWLSATLHCAAEAMRAPITFRERCRLLASIGTATQRVIQNKYLY